MSTSTPASKIRASRLRRRAGGAALIGAPLLIIVSESASIDIGENGRTSLAEVAADSGHLRLWVWLGFAAALLLVPAVLTLVHLLRGRSSVLGHLGAALTVVGAIGYTAHQSIFLTLPTLLSGDRSEMAALYERQFAYAEVGIVTFFVFLLPLFLGFLLLGIALRRARSGPAWPAFALALALVPSFLPLPFDAAFASFALLLAGLGFYGWHVLAMSDACWSDAVDEPVRAAVA
jgi:Domain of unknown function (DUF4386)